MNEISIDSNHYDWGLVAKKGNYLSNALKLNRFKLIINLDNLCKEQILDEIWRKSKNVYTYQNQTRLICSLFDRMLELNFPNETDETVQKSFESILNKVKSVFKNNPLHSSLNSGLKGKNEPNIQLGNLILKALKCKNDYFAEKLIQMHFADDPTQNDFSHDGLNHCSSIITPCFICEAVRGNCLMSLEVILKKMTITNKTLNQAILIACETKNLRREIMHVLLEKAQLQKVNLNFENSSGQTPLLIAYENSNRIALEELFLFNADPDHENSLKQSLSSLTQSIFKNDLDGFNLVALNLIERYKTFRQMTYPNRTYFLTEN